MATQRLKGLWIPAEILLNEELTDKEKTYMYIDPEKQLKREEKAKEWDLEI